MKIIWKITQQDIIDTNQKVISLKLDPLDEFCVRHDVLDDIFDMLDKFKVSDDLQGLLQKGASSYGVYCMGSTLLCRK